MNDIRLEKREARERYSALRDSIDKELKKEYDRKICERVASLSSYRYADVVMLYYPTGSEIDTSLIFEDAKKKGKKTAYPLCISDGVMEYRLVESADDFAKGAFGIMEPKADTSVFVKDDRTNVICIVPALVFDKRGYRLGYGKGYYDRYLENMKGTKIGLCYSSLVAEKVPTGRYDLKVDTLITEKGVMSFA